MGKKQEYNRIGFDEFDEASLEEEEDEEDLIQPKKKPVRQEPPEENLPPMPEPPQRKKKEDELSPTDMLDMVQGDLERAYKHLSDLRSRFRV